jgi:hypothetical protein
MISMNTKLRTALLCAVTIALIGAGVERARGEELDEATKARIAKAEAGPATIDVSKYPQQIQDDYGPFAQKCAQCHKLSRPVNSDYVLPGEWGRYIKRMMYKPGSGINGTEAKQIYEFLVYDSSVRKKTDLEAKLKTLSADERAAEEKKLKEVTDKIKP